MTIESRRASSSIVLALALCAAFACRRETTNVVADPMQDSSNAPSTKSKPLTGVYHLYEDGQDVEPILEIRDDHTFTVYTDNSDANLRFGGRWDFAPNGDTEMRPAANEGPLRFRWCPSANVIARDEKDGVVVTGTCVNDSTSPPTREPFELHYRRGRMCVAGPIGTGVAVVKPCP